MPLYLALYLINVAIGVTAIYFGKKLSYKGMIVIGFVTIIACSTPIVLSFFLY